MGKSSPQLCFCIIFISFITQISLCAFNLIHTVPSCYTENICIEYGEPGTATSAHPNSEERTQFLFRNIARLYPQQYIQSKYGKYLLGTLGRATEFNTDPLCGVPVPYPFYYDPQLNELARYHVWDVHNCQETIGHDTCSTQCHLFTDCTFEGRAEKFVTNGIGEDRQNGIVEDTWNANMGYKTQSHCLNVYDASYIYQGIGSIDDTSLVNTVYGKIGQAPAPYYPMIHGGHFDERNKINQNDYNVDGKYLVFMVEYFGDVIGHIAADEMYLLYDNNVHIMNRIFGDKYSGFYALNFEISDVNNCKPYAFFVVTETSDVYRLPEDRHYFFSTSMIDNSIGICNINHFYYDKTLNLWFGNGSPYIDNLRDIRGVDNTKCLGCKETDALSIKFDDTVRSLESDEGTSNPTPTPTVKLQKLTYKPTAMPSVSPSVQTQTTEIPTDVSEESGDEDNGSMEDGNDFLCCHGSKSWFEWLCKKKSYNGCINDWKCYFDDDECMNNEFDNTNSPVFDLTLESSESRSGWWNRWGKTRDKKHSTFSWKWGKSSSDSDYVNDEENEETEETKETENENTNDWKHKWGLKLKLK